MLKQSQPTVVLYYHVQGLKSNLCINIYLTNNGIFKIWIGSFFFRFMQKKDKSAIQTHTKLPPLGEVI